MSARPVMILLTGPNGAGKSTFFEHVVKPLMDKFDGQFINADEIEKELWPNGGGDSYRAARAAARLRAAHIVDGKSFAAETVFSHPSKLDELQSAVDAGFLTHVVFVGVKNADISVARVASRVEHGGHNVPEDKIRERYVRNQQILLQAIPIAHRVDVFDNSIAGANHQKMLVFKQGKLFERRQILPAWIETLFAEYLNA